MSESSDTQKNAGLLRIWHVLSWIIIIALVGWWIAKGFSSQKSAYPNKPIEVVVPYPAGGGSDTFVRRVIQQGIEEGKLLDVPLVVFNVPGGGGTIGSRDVMNSRPDGYKIICHHTSMISSKLAGTVDFGPDEFAKFAQTGRNTMIVMVREDCPYPDLTSLLQAAAANPKSLKFGANIGSSAYFITLQLEKAVPGAKFNIVSADGGADRYNRLIGGHLDAGIFSLSEYLDFRDADDTPTDRNVKALSVFSEERHPAIPDAGTAIEQGIPVTFSNGYYWWAAKDTPAEIQEYLADVLEKTMQTQIAQSEMERLRIDPTFLRGKDVEADIQTTFDSFKSVIAEENRVVPDFAKYMQMLVLVFFVIVIIVSIRERGQPDEVAIDFDPDSPSFTKRKGRAAACFIVLLGYVLVLVFTPVPFAIASSLMVFITGGFMSAWEKKYRLILFQLALLTGFGAEFVFTNVFTIPLP